MKQMTSLFALAAQRLGDEWHCVVQGVSDNDVVFLEHTAASLALAARNALKGGAPSLAPFLDAMRAAVDRASVDPTTAIESFVLKVYRRVDGGAGWRCDLEYNGDQVTTDSATPVDAISSALEAARSRGAHVATLVREALSDVPERPWAS